MCARKIVCYVHSGFRNCKLLDLELRSVLISCRHCNHFDLNAIVDFNGGLLHWHPFFLLLGIGMVLESKSEMYFCK